MKNWVYFITALPPLWIAVMIMHYGSPMWHGDDWNDLLPIAAHHLDGTLSSSDFWKLLYEHRLVVPRLVMLPIIIATQWDARFLLWASFVVAGFVLLGFNQLRKQMNLSSAWMPLISLMVFSPLAWENWLLGFLMQFWIALAAWVWTIYLASTRYWFWTCLTGAVATFSVSGGWFVWIVIAPVIWRQPLFRWWALIPLTSLLAYYTLNYNPVTYMDSPGYGYALSHPLQALGVFVGYFGNPFCHGLRTPDDYVMSRLVGVVLLVLVAASVLKLRGRWSEIQPALMLVALGVLLAAATSVARTVYFLGESRYIPFCAMFTVGALFVIYKAYGKDLMKMLIPLLVALNLIGGLQAWEWWKSKQEHVRWCQFVAEQSLMASPEEWRSALHTIGARVNPPEQTLRQLKVLKRHGWVKPIQKL